MKSSRLFSTRNGQALLCVFRNFSISTSRHREKHYKLVVVGGGAGGCGVAAKFTGKLGTGNVAIIEPSLYHYYQPLWTLVGGGIYGMNKSMRPMDSVIPKDVDWIRARATAFDPDDSTVMCSNGELIKYDYMVVAMGIQVDLHKIKGLLEALETDPAVTTNYASAYVAKSFPAIKDIRGGNVLFTYPTTPVKCPGAAQKIMYLTEDYLRKSHRRNGVNVQYNTALGVIFGVPRYAESLLKIVEKRNIDVDYKMNLEEIHSDRKEAVFRKLDSDTGETKTVKYSFLHVTPPMSAPDVIKQSPLSDKSGFLDVDKYTLQHSRYQNIFGIGDCTNLPTSKTAAGVASQSGVLRRNMTAVMEGNHVAQKEYTGYTSCPLVTGYGKCIMAEFGYDGIPMETFPLDQSKERLSMYHMKKDVLPEIYWKFLVKGYWEGPGTYRKFMRLGMGHVTKPSEARV
ncbi:hypothetical protein ScPMuIL_002682 [Solemya velum]